MSEEEVPLSTLPSAKPPKPPPKDTSLEGNPEEYEPLAASPDVQGQVDMGYKDSYGHIEGRKGDQLAQTIALASVGVFASTTWIMGLTDPASFSLFTWHPLCLTLALVLFTYGILTLQPTSQPKTKAAGLVRHQLVMVAVGFPLAAIGGIAIIYNKIRDDKAHFTSWHGFFGIITLIFILIQLAVGGGSVWFDGRLFGGNPKAKLIWKYHRVSGYTLYPLFVLTAFLGGALSGWSAKHSVFIVRLFAFWIAPALLLGAVTSRVRTSKMPIF